VTIVWQASRHPWLSDLEFLRLKSTLTWSTGIERSGFPNS
jgi:hypothetical protein